MAPAGRRTDYIFSDKDRSGRGPLRLKIKKKIKNKELRLPDVAPIPFSLTRTCRSGGPLELKIKKIKKILRLPDDEPIPYSLTRTGLVGRSLELKIKK
jgi:hypothetical protein